MRRLLIALAGVHIVAGLSFSGFAQTPRSETPPSPPQSTKEVVTGLLYVFNDSGPTLIPSNQVVTDNGARLVSLPRRTYSTVQLVPGSHLLKSVPPLRTQQVQLNVVTGGRYFVVVAYRPERSWAFPLAGAALVLRQITEEQAAPLLAKMKSHSYRQADPGGYPVRGAADANPIILSE